MIKPKPQPPLAHTRQHSTRMIVAYKYGSLAIMGIGLGWAIIFAVIGWWGVVALDIAIIASGLAIYMLIQRGHLDFGLLAGQASLMMIAIAVGLILDVPTAEAPRVSHIYLLVVAALGYLNYQRGRSRAQLVLISLCLIAFVALASAPLANPFAVNIPETVRVGGTWANTILATAMLAACIHAMHAEFMRKDKFSREMISALLNNEFQLVFQPQVDLAQTTIGAEALLRWNHPKRGLVPPNAFIPQAEKLGLMVSIGGWVLEKGCSTLAEWGKTPELRHLTLSINVSTSQLMHEGFEEFVRDTLLKTYADPKKLTLELTESVLVTDMDRVVAKLDALRAMGITIALDDFGTGYSSLSYLRRLPIQQIKIDRSFVHDAMNSPNGASLAKNVALIGRDLGHTVLAEGVETMEQHALLAEFGSVQFQGYLYGKPMALADFEQHIAAEAERAVPEQMRAGG